jgi:hypothetical protein
VGSVATAVPNTLAATTQRVSFTFLDGCSRNRLYCNITRRPGTFFACCLKARTHRSALANPSRKLQSARCARQGTSPKPLAPFQQTFTRVRGQAEVGNAFAITSTHEKRPEKGFFIPLPRSERVPTPARVATSRGKAPLSQNWRRRWHLGLKSELASVQPFRGRSLMEGKIDCKMQCGCRVDL